MVVNKNSFSFNIGNIRCSVVSDGVHTVPGKISQSSNQNFIEPGSVIDDICLLIETGKHIILIDTGNGVGGQPSAGKLVQNLKTIGITCEDIDIVVISHAHGDHVGGITNIESSLVFSNARYIISREEWEFWTSDPELKQIKVEEDIRQMFCKTVQDHLIPIKSRLDLIDNETNIVPGIKCIKAPGHTPGSIAVHISSNAKQLLFTGDVFHHPLQLAKPHIDDIFDLDSEQASQTRIRMLSKIITPDILVSTSHFPFPGLGHIFKQDNGWFWQPIEINPIGQ